MNEEELINFEDFEKVVLSIGNIKEVTEVEKSNKLLRFKLDDGSENGRVILSGIKKFYPEFKELENKNVIFVKNLKPRKMMGEMSEGMLLSAEKDGIVTLSIIDSNIKPGAILE